MWNFQTVASTFWPCSPEVGLISEDTAASKMKSQQITSKMLFTLAPFLCLVTLSLGAAIPPSCGSIYKSFAQCLLRLGDSLVENQPDQNTQDIDAICRSWNEFHDCANAALTGCPGEAAAVWESLRKESRKTEFSGNLYEMCASRTTLSPTTVPAAQSPPTSDQTNQETLKGKTYKDDPTFSTLFLPVCSTMLVLLHL